MLLFLKIVINRKYYLYLQIPLFFLMPNQLMIYLKMLKKILIPFLS